MPAFAPLTPVMPAASRIDGAVQGAAINAAQHTSQTNTTLDQIFAVLVSREPLERAHAVTNLHELVKATNAELADDARSDFYRGWTSRIIAISGNASPLYARLGAMEAIAGTADLVDGNHTFPRYWSAIRHNITTDNIQLMQAANHALICAVRTVNTYIQSSGVFEAVGLWAMERLLMGEYDRYGAVLAIGTLATYLPAYFPNSPLIPDLHRLLNALNDPKRWVREAASDTLGSCLRTLQDRAAIGVTKSVVDRMYKVARENVSPRSSNKPVEMVHGTLLCFEQLFEWTPQLMQPYYNEVCELVVNLIRHRDQMIRRTVLKTLTPILARYDPSYFAEHHLHLVVSSLTSLLRKDKDSQRETSVAEEAFQTLGDLAQAEGSHIKDYTEQIMACVRSALQNQSRRGAPPVEAVFWALGNLAQSVGPHITRHVHDLLDLLFASGLSTASVRALSQIVAAAPPLLRGAQTRLLNMVSLVLLGEPYRELGAPSYAQYSSITGFSLSSGAARDSNMVRVALVSLRDFDMTGHCLGEFVRDCTMPYLDDDSFTTRREATLTCLAVYAKDPIMTNTSLHSIELVNDVLDKIMTVAVADLEASLRIDTLRHLVPRFDQYLGQADFVRSLFIAFNDENFAVRIEAIKIIGRIAKINPAYTMPTLRNTLIQLLADIELSTQPKSQQQACRLLTMVIQAAPVLVRGYAIPILSVLLVKIKDLHADVAASALAGLGELARVSGEELGSHISGLVTDVVSQLTNGNAEVEAVRRKAALVTLGLVVSNTGYVVKPLIEHQGLRGTLGRILKESAPDKATHHEVSRVLGMLGAVDPNKFSEQQENPDDEPTAGPEPGSDLEMFDVGVDHGWHHEEFYQNTVITLLMRMLQDPNMMAHHVAVVEALMLMLSGGGLQLSRLNQVVPTFIAKIASVPTKSGLYYDQLAKLTTQVKEHIRPFVPQLVSRISEDWDATNTSRHAMVSLIEALCSVLDGEFKTYMPQLLPRMLSVLDSEANAKAPYLRILHSIQLFGRAIEDYLRLVIPVVVRMFERDDLPRHVRKAAIVSIGQISRKVNLSDMSSGIVQTLSRVLTHTDSDPEMRNAAMDTLSALVVQLGTGYAVFISSIDRVMKRHKIHQPLYEKLVAKLLKGEKLAQDLIPDTSVPPPPAQNPPPNDAPSNPVHLRRSWQLGDYTTDEQWDQWMKDMASAFVSEAPSLTIRACRPVVYSYADFALQLFPIAFVACQSGLPEDYKRDLELTFRKVYECPTAPERVTNFLLEIAEVMEHYYEPFPRDIHLLATKSFENNQFPKALHYKEAEFFDQPSPAVIESLMDINTRLRQPDSALGALNLAQETWDMTNKETWYEKLHRWEDALKAFEHLGEEELHQNGAVQISTQIGKMRCLHALSHFQQLAQAVEDAWDSGVTDQETQQLAVLGAAASWSLQRWDALDQFTQIMDRESDDRSFYRAILCTHYAQRERAMKHINRTRDVMDGEVTSALTESYTRSYPMVVRTQMLAELEEALTYQIEFASQPERQAAVRRTWLKRLEGCQQDVEVWQRMLSIHNLVLTPAEDQEARIKFTNLCRSQGRMILASKTLCELMGVDMVTFANIDIGFYLNPAVPPAVSYAHLKFRWSHGSQGGSLALSDQREMQETVLSDLREFTSNLALEYGVVHEFEAGQQGFVVPAVSGNVSLEYLKLLARCYCKQGEWQMAIRSRNEWVTDETCDVLESFRRATVLDTKWYKAWHSWAEANFNVLQYNEEKGGAEMLMKQSIVPAVTGFFSSVILSSKKYALQDTLRILALWFKWGNDPQVDTAMSEGFSSVNIDTWLDVIPQIIARIGSNIRAVRDQIKMLLSSIGAAHPQALIYSLSVATKSNNATRTSAADDIVDSMRDHYPDLVDQAMVVSKELIRLAVLWHELWHEGLEEASRLFHSEHNAEAMFNRLETLHVMMDPEPETMREINFVQANGRDLSEAREYSRRYRQYGDMNDLNSAWEFYYKVFRRISKSLTNVQSLDLPSCAPRLLSMKDLKLSLPGRYKPGKPIVTIKSFDHNVHIITSKQRPRRVKMYGSNGKSYPYLLKGHEDMRQDERVMQLFGLINKLLAQNPETSKRDLRMRRFPVIPLSPNTGMQGWVENTDTMHVLIKDYREPRSILLNIEHRLMLQMAPDYEHLPLLQKMEVFMYSQSKTKGQDLYRVLWLRSPNSEKWLERRINYTRSLGVSAVAGYILGLGDRHPSNLLVDRYTGEVVHIDFGDCFEVAMQRPKYPEKVPFRLTRMLTNAMEVGGIRGTFRITSELVMKVVRDNRAGMITLLEAFVHDPLIGWRLIDGPNSNPAAALPGGTDGVGTDDEARSARAIQVVNRIHSKLEGTDFGTEEPLDEKEQMARLIEQATSVANLCVAFVGWCSFW